MLYHYRMWLLHEQSGLLGKLGIYAVATFYVLSGASLGMVYLERLGTPREIAAFWIRRLFRIVPLFWLVTAATLLVRGSRHDPLLNFSLLFSVFDPAGAIATGAWSIGNELVFYALLPLIALAPRAALAISVVPAAAYAGYLISADASLAAQWPVYVQPLNNLFLFVGGVVIASAPRVRHPLLIGLPAAVVFCLYPMTSQVQLATGTGRLVMSAATLAVVLAVYQARPALGGWAAQGLGFLGQSCYSIYLLHPIAFGMTQRLHASGWQAFAASTAITLGLSWISYRRIERPMMELGAMLSQRLGRGAPVGRSGTP